MPFIWAKHLKLIMTTVTAIKQQRTNSKRSFTRKVNKLNDLLDEKVVLSEVEACFDDVKEAWKMVEQKHDVYLDAVQEEDLEADEWIQEVQETYVKARRSVLSLQSRLLEEKHCDRSNRTQLIARSGMDAYI